MTEAYEHVSDSDFYRYMTDDQAVINYANEIRLSLKSAPTQSLFRVLAILFVKYDGDKLKLVIGTNAEPGYIVLLKVAIVTDNDLPIAPGALCREYLNSVADPDTVVVMGNASGGVIESCTLGQIWPHPYVYRSITRHEILPLGKQICYTITHPTSAAPSIEAFVHLPPHMIPYAQKAVTCAKAALRRASRQPRRAAQDQLHPVNLAACLIYEDFTVHTATLLKGLEYGCSLDPVSQLVFVLEQNRVEEEDESKETVSVPAGSTQVQPPAPPSQPMLLVQLDQFGIFHAPFAQARALLYEGGWSTISVLVHDMGEASDETNNQKGEIKAASVAALFPPPGVSAKDLTPQDFQLCRQVTMPNTPIRGGSNSDKMW